MLRRTWTSILTGVCVLSLGSLASAQDPAGVAPGAPGTANPPPAGARPHRGGPASQPGGRQFGPGGGMLAGLGDQLQLTAEQKPKFDAIVADFQKKLEAAREANKEKVAPLLEKMKAARDANDEAAMKTARDELQAIQEQTIKPIMDQAVTDIKAILTPEQQAKLDEAKARMQQNRAGGGRMGGGMMGNLLPQLNLTADQQKKVDDARSAMMEKLQAAKTANDQEAMKAAFEDYQSKLKTILTEEQQKKLEELRSQHQPPQGKPGQPPAGGPKIRSHKVKENPPRPDNNAGNARQ